MLIIVSLLVGACGSKDRSAPATEQKRVLSMEDSLWLANDYAQLGFDRYSYEEWDSGLVYFDQALEYNPMHSQAWHGRGLMLDTLQREDEAEYSYQQAERFDPKNKQAIFHLGCFYARAGEKDKALKQLRTVVALDSQYGVMVRTEECWTNFWDDPEFLETVGALK